MKRSFFEKVSGFETMLASALLMLATVVAPAQTQPCVDTNGVKYVQPPNPSGFDAWNSGPWVLADDFICTNTGPIAGIHLWGSWLNDQHGTITNFWLGIYADVPVSANNPNSHPGNLLWSESFPIGQFAESQVGPSQEQFLDPGPGAVIGTDTQIWYYCFQPTTPFTQTGSITAPITYWLAAYAQVSSVAGSGPSGQFGWKTTFIVQNDVSVHEPWTGSLPGTNSNWLPTAYQLPTGGQEPLDLAFMLTTPTNPPCLSFVCPFNLTFYMPCGFSCMSIYYPPPAFATNLCDPAAGVTVTYSTPSGFCFPLGTTPVTMTVSGSGQTSNCTFLVTVLNNPNCPPTNNPPCLDFVCPSNLVLYMPCGFNCVTISNYPPAFATNYCSPAAGVTVTYSPPPGFCFPLGTTPVTMTVSGSGQTSNCTFSVTVLNNPNCPPTNNPPCLDFVCPSNIVFYGLCDGTCVTGILYPPSFATNYCNPSAGVTVTYNPPQGHCFTPGTTLVTMTVSGSGETSNCTFTVTYLIPPGCPSNPPPVACVDTNGAKYDQEPNLDGGYDIWNSSPVLPQTTDGPWVLADDFVCNQTGQITDLHLWGSWLNNQVITNKITFTLGIYDDVPAVTNAANGQVTPSHPGNLLWTQTFAPGQYAETFYGTGTESFLDPGPPVNLGPENYAYYYCFNPTNLYQQQGQTYWFAAFAQLPAGTSTAFGWKTTSQVANDVSVHTVWPGTLPPSGAPWIPTISDTGIPLDLAFRVTTPTNNCVIPITCNQITRGHPAVVPCGSSLTFIPPTVGPSPCCTNPTVLFSTVTNSGPCSQVIIATWTILDCSNNVAGVCGDFYEILDTNAPILLNCGTNKTVECGTAWTFDPPPTAQYVCSGSNEFVGILSSNISIVSSCTSVGTIVWSTTNQCTGAYSTCTQIVTVVDTPIITCPTNIVVLTCNSNVAVFWSITAYDNCGNVPYVYSTPPSGTVFPVNTTNTVVGIATNACGNASFCTFTVTVLRNPNCTTNPPVVCVESDYEKYVQWPMIINGFDVWNNPYVLADDFICTNTGPVSDIHLWGSWLNDLAKTNSITFWLGIYDDVPAVTNVASGKVTPSHPSTNLMWQQWFAPGQYAEQIWSANAAEQFLDPGPTNIMGSDSIVWYYCFYPTNAFEQTGTPTNSKTYWLAAYAQLPSGTTNFYGWKTATNQQHDVSVHAIWPGAPPTNNPGWTPTFYQPVTGGPAVPLDLAFKVTMCGPVKIRYVTPKTVVLTWPGGGYLQSATNVTGPYIDVPGFPLSPYTDSTSIPPTNRFYRVRCY